MKNKELVQFADAPEFSKGETKVELLRRARQHFCYFHKWKYFNYKNILEKKTVRKRDCPNKTKTVSKTSDQERRKKRKRTR